jgi:hypothetical protein
MEAYGLSLLEAVAAETSIVASDLPVHRELIKKFKINHVSLLSPNSSPKDLASSIVIAMEHSSRVGEKLPSWQLATERTQEVYKKVLKMNKTI